MYTYFGTACRLLAVVIQWLLRRYAGIHVEIGSVGILSFSCRKGKIGLLKGLSVVSKMIGIKCTEVEGSSALLLHALSIMLHPFVIFNFSHILLLWNCERNLTKLDRKQELNVLYKVCVFLADQKRKMVAQASDWLRHFWWLHVWLLLYNGWTEFDETWQGASTQHLLPSMFFPGQ